MGLLNKLTGTIVKGGPNNAIETDDKQGLYYISNFESLNTQKMELGTKVKFIGSHPGDGRGVATKVEEIK